MKLPKFIKKLSSSGASRHPSQSQSSRKTCKTEEAGDDDASPAASVSDAAFRRPSVEGEGPIGVNSRPRCVPPVVLGETNHTLNSTESNLGETDHTYNSTRSNRRPSSSLRSGRRLVGSLSSRELTTSFTTRSLATSGQCPYRHGTVYSDPYPGYIHGNPKRGICPNGCRPEMNTNITDFEARGETLMREAMEYIHLYYKERQDEMKGTTGFLSKEDRMNEIKKSIESTGTYEHTFDELQHGARVAWRNAPKCSNRKYWQQLKLLDQRKVATNKEMFNCCIQHLSKAMSCGSSEAYITVFKPAPPEKKVDGPRIWNDQLLQYAAYAEGDEVVGDPKNLRFTEMLKERFGWDGPPDGKKGKYDYLPLIIQADPNGPPELFELPLDCAPPVHIHHPRYPELASLDMQWYPIPAVCALDLTVGGIVYTAVPFNGWYANTEVLRDLTDESRYNMLIPVAKALGMDTDTKPGDAPLWKDEVMHILSSAVCHSFKAGKVAMIDHHTLIDMFWKWYGEEMLGRKYCPVNWKWVIPPMSPTLNRAYLGLNKAQDYTIKPAYLFGKSAFQLETKHFGRRDTSKAMAKLMHSIWLAILFKRAIARMRARKQPLLIIYASVTGNAAKYASDLGAILRSSFNISFFDACGVNAAADLEVFTLVETSALIIFVSSTQGNGELPSLSNKFFSFLFENNAHLLNGKQCAVLGFGSSSYPIFCGAAVHLSMRLAEVHAEEVVPRGECDAVKGESATFYDWTTNLVINLARMPNASSLVLKLSENMMENTASKLVRTRSMQESVKVEVFAKEKVQEAAAQLYMNTRKSSRGFISSRRSSISSMDESTHSAKGSLGPLREEQQLQIEEQQRIIQIMGSSANHAPDKQFLEGRVMSREDLVLEVTDGDSESVTRKTSLVKIDLNSCGNPPYQPGDHIRVFPRNVISLEELQTFVGHLSFSEEKPLSLDDNIYVSFDNKDVPKSELAVALPLLSECLGHLMPLEYFFQNQVALESAISMQACLDLSQLATNAKDRTVLRGIGENKNEYESMISLCGMKWIDIFKTFPSLSKQVTISFLLCNMKMNHPRSYSISSCKEVVGSELHLVVGKFIFSRGGSKMEAGVCSNFLTHIEPDDDILFRIESAPSFRYPLDPSSPIIFVCTGTGFAPIRGLIQKRSYFKSRGEKLGPAYLIFGSRCSAEGLFHDEIEEFQKQAVLTKVFMCYSREMGEAKEYTTDKLRCKRVSKILSPVLLQPNTHIFICGSANMAEDCKNALRDTTTQESFDAITDDGRLHCDVFGALSSRTKKPKRNVSYSMGYSMGDLFDEDLEVDFDIDNFLQPSRTGRNRGGVRGDLGSSCIMLGSTGRGRGSLGRAQSVSTGLGAGELGMALKDVKAFLGEDKA